MGPGTLSFPWVKRSPGGQLQCQALPVVHESVAHVPHSALRPVVAGIVGYRHEGLAAGLHRGLPSPFLTMIVTVDEPLVLAAHADLRQAPDAYDAMVAGLHTRPALIAHAGRQFGVQVSLRPLAARALLGLPAGELSSLDCRLDDVLGRAAAELTDRLRAATDWAGRFAALERTLLRVLGTNAERRRWDPEVGEAWRLVTASAGRLRVDEIARRVGWSGRHLAARFRAETGLTPKQAARVARFDRARRVLGSRAATGAPLDLAGLAVDGGYYDQAHLTREWRALSGLPPARWLAEEFGFLQDAEVVGTPL
jgi:AraC-like DNA-binding protein